MTVPTQTNKVIATGNGVTTVFPFTFGTLPSGDLVVTLFNLAGVEIPQTEGANYTVTGKGNENGGSITFSAAPPSGYTVLIQRVIPLTQPTDYKNQGSFYPKTHERSFDRATMQIQQLSEEVGRSIRVPVQASGVSTELPLPSPMDIIGWNSDGSGLENYSPSTFATSVVYGDTEWDVFTGDGSEVDFTLSFAAGSVGNLDVSIDGVVQVPATDYSLLGNIITFAVAPSNGEKILVRYDLGLPIGSGFANQILFTDPIAPAFLKTTSDILNGIPVSVFRFINNPAAQMAAVRARTSLADHTTAINTGIAALNDAGGGELVFGPFGTFNAEGITPKNHVRLVGADRGIGWNPVAGEQAVCIKALGDGSDLISQMSGDLFGFGVSGFLLMGPNNSAIPGSGIYLSNASYANIKNNCFRYFSDHAFRVDAGLACQLSGLMALNCLLDRTRSQKDGVIHLGGTDHYFSSSEITASTSALTDSNKRVCAVAIYGSTCMLERVVAEISDVGFYIGGTVGLNNFLGCRSDLNYGDGTIVDTGVNMFSNHLSLSNGIDANNSHDNYVINGVFNVFSSCVSHSIHANKPRYGFNDTLNSGAQRNQYVGCLSISAATQNWKTVDSFGSAVDFGENTPFTLTVNSTTPSVADRKFWRTLNTNPTAYTDFLGMPAGNPLKIICFDSNSSLVHGTKIFTNTGANKTMSYGRIYRFTNVAGIWYEEG